MGRNRRWVLEDSIQDTVWKTILRGPRPPWVRWEKQRSVSAVANTANARKDPKKETKSKDASNQSPPEMHAENLERALSRARTQVVAPPVSAQIISTKVFIEREKKRLVTAEQSSRL